MTTMVERIINRLSNKFSKRGNDILRAKKVFAKYKEYTMIPEDVYVENLLLVSNFSQKRGCVVECGVWRGGMSAGIAEILPNRKHYLFDSFEGLPEAKDIDGTKALQWQKNVDGKNYYNNCAAEMGFAEEAMKMSSSKYELIKGWFNETLPSAQFEDEIIILRLDGDWYESTMDCFKNLYSKVATGGIVILDDYYTWDGCSRAVHDYLSSIKSVSRISQSSLGVPYIIKKD